MAAAILISMPAESSSPAYLNGMHGPHMIKRHRVGSSILRIGVPEFSVVHVRRGDADLLPRPQLILEFGDRVGVMVRREHRDITRKHFGDSIKGTTEFSYVSLGVGMALGMLFWAFFQSRSPGWESFDSA